MESGTANLGITYSLLKEGADPSAKDIFIVSNFLKAGR